MGRITFGSMSDGVVGVLGPHAEMVGELLEWWEEVASGRSSSQLVTVRTDRAWGPDVVAGLLGEPVGALSFLAFLRCRRRS